MSDANIPTCQQMSILELQSGGLQNIGCTEQDIRNARRNVRKANDGHDADMLNEHFLAQKEKNPYFTYTIETDDENQISHIFWADATSREAYKVFGDVVVFDTTHSTNQWKMLNTTRSLHIGQLYKRYSVVAIDSF
ncbi:hypothetical protein L1049_017469 [Liquidambar formosana]|uniref:ZSWIM1/3 RNaseH-like domain-containing protein n=1 Tax=Liquidambar formosana TaxID=63359 RepID=A0AAP0X7E2_LIQFO